VDEGYQPQLIISNKDNVSASSAQYYLHRHIAQHSSVLSVCDTTERVMNRFAVRVDISWHIAPFGPSPTSEETHLFLSGHDSRRQT